MPIDQPTQIHLQTRNRTIAELSPQMSSSRMLVNAAAGQAQDGYTTLTMSDDTAELLAQILVRYNSAAEATLAGDSERTEREMLQDVLQALRPEPDHDTAFWDQVAGDLLVAREIPPPTAGATALVFSLGRTGDR